MFYNSSCQKAKKVYECDFCKEEIKVNDFYVREVGREEGKITTRKICGNCYAALMALSKAHPEVKEISVEALMTLRGKNSGT